MPLSHQDQDNLTRWKAGKRGFYEVYYLKAVDPKTGCALWVRYTLLAPKDSKIPPTASVWGIYFDSQDSQKNFGIKKTVPAEEAQIGKMAFSYAVGQSVIAGSEARGELRDGPHSLAWDLKFSAPGFPTHHYPNAFYKAAFPKTKYLAPYASAPISGEFNVDGRTLVLQNAPAHQGHIWGTQYAASWLWGHCNQFNEDPGFYCEALSARVLMGTKAMPALTLLFFQWEGKHYALNAPWQWRQNTSRHEINSWHFEGSSHDVKFVGDFSAKKSDMVAVRYETPDGCERFCHHSEIADMKVQILKKTKTGWESKMLTASRTAALEVVQGSAESSIRRVIA